MTTRSGMEPPKGTRDVFSRNAERKRRLILALHETFSSYGFEYFESPSFERFEVLTGKFSGGEEILSEIFRFSDRGQRDLGLRFDHTVPLGRFVAHHPELPLPFKRYTIGSSFRDGPIKTGRLREFTQADADIVGAQGVESEIELLRLAADVFSDLDISVDIRINHRVILETIVRFFAPDVQIDSVILTLDKLEKIGADGVREELNSKSVERADELLALISDPSFAHSLGSFLETYGSAAHDPKVLDDAIADLTRIVSLQIPGVRIDPSLARGLNYYTGIVFEAFDASKSFTSALAAGGRYADLIGQWGGSALEATGISFGVDALIESGLVRDERDQVGIHIAPISAFDEAFPIAHLLRREGVRVSIDLLGRGPSKNLKYADANGYSHVLIVGKKELESGSYTLKTLASGEQQEVSIEQLVRMFTEQVL